MDSTTSSARSGDARWGGTPLALLLEEAGVLANGTEVVFWGADSGKLTIRDNAGILSGGKTGLLNRMPKGALILQSPSNSRVACPSPKHSVEITCSVTK